MFMDNYIDMLSPLGITALTPVQEKVIPLLSSGKSILFQADTGTGKTFAYLLPLIRRIEGGGCPAVIIVAPTLELSSQIKRMARQVSSMKTAILCGSSPLKRQIDTLKEKPDIVIGSAARLCALIRLKKLKTSSLIAVVFDEVDRLVKKDTIDDTKALLCAIPCGLQIIGCSATVTKKARELFDGIDVVELPSEDVLTSRVEHWAIFAQRRDKIDTLRSLLRALGSAKVLVFASRGYDVDKITSLLSSRGVECEGLYAKTDKQRRKVALDRFRSGKVRILITSDIAARGMDISGITHVVQMDIGEEVNDFIHRAGRTGRAGTHGVNVVIGDEAQLRRLSVIEKQLSIVVHPKALSSGKIVSPSQY